MSITLRRTCLIALLVLGTGAIGVTGVGANTGLRPGAVVTVESTGWCGQISAGARRFRIRAHNLKCAAARTLASRYMATGRYPHGYLCAASILYCWTSSHSHWFRGYVVAATPPPAPAPSPPPPPPAPTV